MAATFLIERSPVLARFENCEAGYSNAETSQRVRPGLSSHGESVVSTWTEARTNSGALAGAALLKISRPRDLGPGNGLAPPRTGSARRRCRLARRRARGAGAFVASADQGGSTRNGLRLMRVGKHQ
jgi:hypothetical protein